MSKRNVHVTLYGKTSFVTVMVIFAALLLAGCGGRSEPASGEAAAIIGREG